MVSAQIRVVMRFGVVYKYTIYAPTNGLLAAKAREHCDAIIHGGFRDNDGEGVYTHWPVSEIKKVQAVGIEVPTGYPTTLEGT